MHAIILTWIMSIIVSLPIMHITTYRQYIDHNNNIENQCYLDITHGYYIYMVAYTSIIIFIPSIFLTVLYVTIIYKLRVHYNRTISEVSLSTFKSTITRNSLESNEIPKKRTNTLEVNINPVETKVHFYSDIYHTGQSKRKNLFIKKGKRNDSTSSLLQNTQPKCPTTRRQTAVSLDTKYKAFNSRKKFTLTILCMTVAFFCCQLPIRIFLMWSFTYHFNQNESSQDNFTNSTSETLNNSNHPEHDSYNSINLISFTARLIYFLHGISNPIIYNISSSKFRRAFFNLFSLSKSK